MREKGFSIPFHVRKLDKKRAGHVFFSQEYKLGISSSRRYRKHSPNQTNNNHVELTPAHKESGYGALLW